MRARRRLGLMIVAAVLVVTSGAASGFPPLEVIVGRREVIVPPPATVGHALRRAHVVARDGALRSVLTHAVLDAHWSRARLWLDGRPATDRARLRPGDRLRVVAGRDAIERSVRRQVAAPSAGLPDIEHTLWVPGLPGIAQETVGQRSGEVKERTLLRAPTTAAPMPGRVVALSFDDGPDPRWTPQVLKILRGNGITATFCVIGQAARAHPELIKALAASGNLVCDHTETHPYLDRLTPDRLDAEVAGPLTDVQQLLGQAPMFLRPPYGAVNANVVAAAHRHGLRVLEWSVDPKDFQRPPVAVLVSRVLHSVRPGGIVLLHDGGGDRSATIAALPLIIIALRAQGYSFVQPALTPSPS